MSAISNAEVQKARAYLFSHHRHGFRISARQFAAAAKELGVGFRDLLRFIGQLYARGQNRSAFREAAVTKMIRGGS